MEKFRIVVGCLLFLSVAAFVIPTAIVVVRQIYRLALRFNRNKPFDPYKKPRVSDRFLFYGGLIASIWLLRYAVGYYMLTFPEKGAVSLTWIEEIANSFVHTLQTFSMDEDYTEYITAGREMICKILGEGAYAQFVYGIYASFLNFIAPIAGGAIVAEVLVGIFPKLRLWLWTLPVCAWRKKYYFSKLTEGSLAFAKNIAENERGHFPVLIFTDVCDDGERELFNRAKQLGAICICDEFNRVRKPTAGKCEYHLIDEDEFCNLKNLTELAEERNFKFLKNASVYFFVQSDAYIQIEKQISIKLKNKMSKEKLPTIVPIKCYRNAVQNLLSDVPLYEPLVNKKDAASLNVTILGNGIIGTEAFLNIYWLGQMLVSTNSEKKADMTQCEITVNVVSQDTEEEFRSKINYVNPEILRTVQMLGDDYAENTDKLLEYDCKGNKNSPYLKVSYTQSDVDKSDFWGNVFEKKNIAVSDYIIVALGSDEDNISVAEKLRLAIGKNRVESTDVSEDRKTVIAYAVFDSVLAETLNNKRCFESKADGKCDVYMYAFGALDKVYSCDNVYMSQSLIWAMQTGKAYINAQCKASLDNDNKNRIGKDNYEDANYKYWANLARALHAKYKVFSLGWIKDSVFDCTSEEQCEAHFKNVNEQCEMFKTLAKSIVPEGKAEEYNAKYVDIELKKHCMAWLEHRRWCAFTRTMGYQYADITNMMGQCGDNKDMSLKLHACLAEARKPSVSDNAYILAHFNKEGKIDEKTVFCCKDEEKFDLLDIASYTKREYDFKMYDYYRYELD